MTIVVLTWLLRIAGLGLIALSLAHIPISRRLQWEEDSSRLSPVNSAIFRVHAFFICLVLVMMGLPCLTDPGIFLEPSRAGGWISWSFSAFWTARLYCQWFVYDRSLWTGKPMETGIHWLFTLIWLSLASLFGACGLWQCGWRP